MKQGIFDQKTWEAKESEKTKPNPAFRVRFGPGNVLLHRPSGTTRPLDEGTLKLTKFHFTAVEEEAAQRQAQRLLERQVEHTIFRLDHEDIPIAAPSPSLKFRCFPELSSLHVGSIRPIDEYESHIWHLASILFDDSTEELTRKQALSTFFKELVSRSVWNDLSRTRHPAERIFLNLTGYRLNDACIEATKNKDLHLATLIALAENSSSEFRKDIRDQLEVWRKDGSAADIQPGYRAIYELICGELDGRGTAISSLGLGKRIDWRRTFAMRLWYSIPADGGIKLAVQEYWTACQQDTNISKPTPWYGDAKEGIFDGLFQLLRLYSSTGVNFTLDDALNTYCFSNAGMDVRLSWHLYLILSQLQQKAQFADSYGTKGGAISDSGERLTLSYVNQLEHLKLWQWAIYVALHLRRSTTRKGVILDLLARHISTIQSEVEEQGIISQLTDQWKIPMEWILEAKVPTS